MSSMNQKLATKKAAAPVFSVKPTRNPTLTHKHEGFTCPKCGYPAYSLAKHTHCPLCITCSRCGLSVRNCSCHEGE